VIGEEGEQRVKRRETRDERREERGGEAGGEVIGEWETGVSPPFVIPVPDP